MTSQQFRSSLEVLGWKQNEFAKKLGITVEHVSRWANDKSQIPQYVITYLDAMKTIKRIRDAASDE